MYGLNAKKGWVWRWDMYTKHKWEGGHAQLKICYGYKHNSWEVAYAGDELVEWLLSYKKSSNVTEEV